MCRESPLLTLAGQQRIGEIRSHDPGVSMVGDSQQQVSDLVGRNQAEFIEVFGKEVLPALQLG